MSRGRKFELDRANGKLLGVCAGLAKTTGWDATLIRVAMVVATLAFHWTLLFYFVAAWVGKRGKANRFDSLGGTTPKRSSLDLRRSTTEIDRRLAEVDTYVATQNTSLAREIESLR
jgi:phage shock protein C